MCELLADFQHAALDVDCRPAQARELDAAGAAFIAVQDDIDMTTAQGA